LGLRLLGELEALAAVAALAMPGVLTGKPKAARRQAVARP
jgi:hypothetical protein